MNYLIVVFSSRRDATAFYDILLSWGYNAFIINTPRALAMSCGISVKTSTNALYAIRSILERREFQGYVGTYYFCNGNYSKI